MGYGLMGANIQTFQFPRFLSCFIFEFLNLSFISCNQTHIFFFFFKLGKSRKNTEQSIRTSFGLNV